MRIGVIGAGAVGGAIAALLQRAGHEIEVTARGAHLEAIRAHGIRLSGGWVDHVAPVLANDRLERAPQLVLVTTKAQDAREAIRENIALLRGVPVVVVHVRNVGPYPPISGRIVNVEASVNAEAFG